MNHQYFTENGNQKFPLSTQALAFMQEQIKLAYGLTDLAGQNIIVREPTASVPGLVIYDGELLPLTGTRPVRLGYIVISESTETISVEGRYEGNVRTTRVALYAATVRAGGSQQRKSISSFTTLKSISVLMAELDEAKQHHVPTGAIMMWSGAIADIPSGWALCNGQNGTPNLQARFIVGAGTSIVMDNSKGYQYSVGQTGGHNEVALTENQMPKHGAHLYDTEDEWKAYADSYNSTTQGGPSTEKRYLEINALKRYDESEWINRGWLQQHGNEAFPSRWKRGNNEAHENRPLFYALAYIMKII